MEKLKLIAITTLLLMQAAFILAQSATKKKLSEPKRGVNGFPELAFTEIPGAPKLSAPVLVTGTEKLVVSEGMGLAAPAFYDWDGDGLKDLLIGEFGSGTENGRYIGNFIRVYKNSGTEAKPEFTGNYNYASPPFDILSNGTPYSVDQYCCIGFTPQFIDLNNDGQLDMITGQYYGEVSWFRGSKKGFLPGETLPQTSPAEGDPRNGQIRKKAHQYYWLYSSASFGDLTGDGKPDLVVGGIMALCLSKNVGRDSEPQFGKREMLLDPAGNPLKVHEFTQEELKYYEDRKSLGYIPPLSGNDELSPYVVDWDGDGALDLLVTNTYRNKGLATVDFFKGVHTQNGYRFQQAVPLFIAKNNGKAFPGSGPRVFVTDWNNDGVNDLLIGTSVQTVRGEFNSYLSWNWEKDHGIIKDPFILSFDLSKTKMDEFFVLFFRPGQPGIAALYSK
ncbi:MAG: VCBS repeat-containing protein, partial [Sphingobacteriales bacterium]